MSPALPATRRTRRLRIATAVITAASLAAGVGTGLHVRDLNVQAAQERDAAASRARQAAAVQAEDFAWIAATETKARLAAVTALKADRTARHATAQAGIDAATAYLAASEGKATPQTREAMQVAIDNAILFKSKGVYSTMQAYVDAIAPAQAAVAQSIADWEAQQAQIAAQKAAAEKAAKDAAARKWTMKVTAPRAEQPQPAPAGQPGSLAIYQSYLNQIGATGYDISEDFSRCIADGSRELGPGAAQGCAAGKGMGNTIFLKSVPNSTAFSNAGKYVAIHEYMHILQQRVGWKLIVPATDAIFGKGNGIEMSADCMAAQYGVQANGPGYTKDCSGARGDIARAILAGHV